MFTSGRRKLVVVDPTPPGPIPAGQGPVPDPEVLISVLVLGPHIRRNGVRRKEHTLIDDHVITRNTRNTHIADDFTVTIQKMTGRKKHESIANPPRIEKELDLTTSYLVTTARRVTKAAPLTSTDTRRAAVKEGIKINYDKKMFSLHQQLKPWT